MARIDRIYRYPVKGLSAAPLTAIPVAVGEELPSAKSGRRQSAPIIARELPKK